MRPCRATIEPCGTRVAAEGFGSERTLAYEAGSRGRFGERVRVDLALSHNRYDRLLSLEAGSPFVEAGRQVTPFRTANGLEDSGSGLEVASEVRLARGWTAEADCSYLSLDLEAELGSTDRTSAASGEASPRHVVNARSSWTLPAEAHLGVGCRWVGAAGPRVPAYSSVSARVSWAATSRLDPIVVGRDLLRDHHAEFGGASLTEVERSVHAEARWRW